MSEPAVEPELKLRILLPACLGSSIDFVESHHTLQETISDVREALAATSVLNSMTNYSLVHKGVRVTDLYDDFTPLSEALGDVSGEVALDLVERPYTLKDVYEHLVRFRENAGMNFFDNAAKSEGVVSGSRLNSLGLRDIVVPPQEEKEEEKNEEEKQDDDEKKDEKEEDEKKEDTTEKEHSVALSDEDKKAISDIVQVLLTPSTNWEARAEADSVLAKWKIPIKSLSLLQWNPVPLQQRTKGDLLYLTLTTLESETYLITCHASGFFVSRLANAHFNPALKVNEKGVFHREYLLGNLVSKLSAKYLETIAKNKEILSSSSQFSESYLIPSQIPAFPWLVSESQLQYSTVPDTSRAQIPVFSNGVDGADAIKDWNDEFQGIKEFARESFNERLMRDKLLNKYIQEFSSTATATAVGICKGNYVPLNPNEPRDKHIFLRNNIFYSFGVNATGAHDNTGGDEAARYCFAKDLSTVKLVNRIDIGGVCNLLTCIVDYLGERVVCQAPVPGVFADSTDAEGNPVDKVACGYLLESNTIKTSDDFNNVLRPYAEAFHLKTHDVKVGSAEGKRLVVSKDTKGIVGTDNRKYIIDLYRSAPLDIEFLDAHFNSSETSYPHREACVRHEAVEEWYKRKAAAYFKVETERLEKEGLDKDKTLIAIPEDQITVNPDTFTGTDDSDEDKETVRELSQFVLKHLLPEFLDDVAKNAVPYDGAQLTDYMHKTGVNVRYLGVLASEALKRVVKFQNELADTVKANEALVKIREEEKKEKEEKKEEEKKTEEKNEEEKKEEGEDEKEKKESSAAKLFPVVANMTALNKLCIQEMVARGVKHVLRKLGAGVPVLLKSHFVAHVHNCLFDASYNVHPTIELTALYSPADLEFTTLTSAEIRLAVEKEVYARFRYTLGENWEATLRPVSLLREIAHKYGIQWHARDYFTTEKVVEPEKEKTEKHDKHGKHDKHHHKGKNMEEVVVKTRTAMFEADDIVGFVPLVRDLSFRCSFVDEIFETARHQIQTGEKNVGVALMSELVTFYQQIYGSVHSETAGFYSTLAQIYAECNMTAEASIVARKAVVLYERLTGTDSYETINAYAKASFYDSLNKDHVSAFVLNTQAFEDWCAVYGADHPNTVNTVSNFGTILQELKIYKDAHKFFEHAIELSIQLNGELSDITGIIRHRYGVALVQTENFKAALEQFKLAGDIFTKVVGPDDVLSKECVSFSVNLAGYLAYNEHQLAEKRKQAKAVKAAAKPAKTAKPVKSKKGKKSDPDMGSKSVEEILQFIEGTGKKKNKK